MRKIFQAMLAIITVFALSAALVTTGSAAGADKQVSTAVVQSKSIKPALKLDVPPAPHATTNRVGSVEPSAKAEKSTVPYISARPKEQPNITPYSGLDVHNLARADPASNR